MSKQLDILLFLAYNWISMIGKCILDAFKFLEIFWGTFATTAAKSLQSCLTLCDPIPGILQARTLEWVAISFSNA